MPSELSEKVLLLLAPNMGISVARAVVTEACKSINADLETLDSNNLKPFLEQLEKSLVPRVGNGIAKKTIDKLMEYTAKTVTPVKQQVAPETKLDEGINREIDIFLEKNNLPTENDVQEYSKHLTMKYGGDARLVEKNLIDKIKLRIRDSISKKKVKEEIKMFLNNFPHPEKNDIDDFIRFLRISKIAIDEAELRKMMENERLRRKFEGTHEDDRSKMGNLIDMVHIGTDKGAIGDAMKKQGLTYLIKDEAGESEESLSEFIDFMTPSKNDMKEALKNMGLDHLLKK